MSNIVGRIWPASWKDYKKKVIEKLRYEHSLRLSWFWGVYQAQSSPLCGVYRLTFGRCLVAINFPEPYFNSGPFTSHWWLIILAIIFHISFTWIFVKRAARVISCTHYFGAPHVTPDLTTLLELNIQSLGHGDYWDVEHQIKNFLHGRCMGIVREVFWNRGYYM